MAGELEVAKTKSDVMSLNNKRAVACGRYTAIQRPVKGVSKRDMPRDRAVLDLADGTKLYLESLDSPKSVRPASELTHFDGRRVRVRGVLHSQMPSEGQSLVAPCISHIDEISEE